MKTLIASTLILFASGASADWEAAWGTDELMINHAGEVALQSATDDPVPDSAFGRDNPELFAGHAADNIGGNDRTAFELYYENLYDQGA
ncbi:MAG: hypothetical protein P8Z31_05710 [Gammaproteobacteria bacterium]|jgi:hypothetical protein